MTPESHLFSRPLYSGKWPLHDQILFDAIMKTNECNMIIYWGVPQFQSWHRGELRCNPGNTKLCLSSLSTLSLVQIISSSSLQSISLLRVSINQRKHGSVCLHRMTLTDPGIIAHLKPNFIILFLGFHFFFKNSLLYTLSKYQRKRQIMLENYHLKNDFSNLNCHFNMTP